MMGYQFEHVRNNNIPALGFLEFVKVVRRCPADQGTSHRLKRIVKFHVLDLQKALTFSRVHFVILYGLEEWNSKRLGLKRHPIICDVVHLLVLMSVGAHIYLFLLGIQISCGTTQYAE